GANELSDRCERTGPARTNSAAVRTNSRRLRMNPTAIWTSWGALKGIPSLEHRSRRRLSGWVVYSENLGRSEHLQVAVSPAARKGFARSTRNSGGHSGLDQFLESSDDR